jgi:RNA polymerase sigma-70 factor (ECF subfamily)
MPDTLINDLEVRRRAWGLAFALMGNAEDAEDVVQDALIVAFDKARSIPQADRARWFVGVVRNVARNQIRKRRKRAMNELTEDHATSQRDRLDTADAESLIAALQEVSDDEREAIVLCHMQGFSLDEVSAMLDINRNTLKSRIQRGIAYLREKLRVSAPGLEAYLAAVAIPPPNGGFDMALARWTRGARPAAPWLPYWAKVLTFSGATAMVLVALWIVAAPRSVPEQTSRVAASSDEPNRAESSKSGETRATETASADRPTDSPKSDPKAGQPKSAIAPDESGAAPTVPDQTGKKPRDVVTPGRYRTRIKFYENGTIEAQWTELERTPNLFTLDGNYYGFYPTGFLREVGQFANNKRVGAWRSFHDNAALESSGEYLEGLQEGIWDLFNKERILLEKGSYAADKRCGEWRIFYSDTGTLREVVTFRLDLRHGLGVRYDKHGNVEAETNWDAGQKHGVERNYGPQGVEEHEYNHGERVK